MRTFMFNLTVAILSLFILTSATVPATNSTADNRGEKQEQTADSRDKGQKAKDSKRTARLDKRHANAKTQKQRTKLQKKMHKRDASKGVGGILALVFGGLAFIFGVLAFLITGPWLWLAFLFSIPAIILGIVGLKGDQRTMSLIGLITGAVAFLVALLAFVFIIVLVASVI